MTTPFVILAAGLVLLALPLLVLPLLARPGDAAARRAQQVLADELRRLDAELEAARLDAAEHARQSEVLRARLGALAQDRAAPRSRLQVVTLVSLLLALPLGVTLIYARIGQPEALRMAGPAGAGVVHGEAPALDSAEMRAAIDQLAQRLREQPEDLQGWVLLARAYQATQRYPQARDAFAEALRLAPTEPNLIIEFAEAIAMASPDRSLAGEPTRLIERALELDPDNQRGMWMRGVAARQQGDYAGAVHWWSQLLQRLPAEAPVRAAIEEQLAEAQALQRDNGATASLRPSTTATAVPGEPAPAAGLVVNVELDPQLKDRLPPGAALFVFARPAEGPRMPVAIQRLSADRLPVTVRLDDSHAMVEGMTLSTTPQVVVGARVSLSGDATPRSGDLEGLAGPLPGDRPATVSIRIDQVIP